MEQEPEIEIISRWNSTDVRKEYADGYRLELLHYLSAVDKIRLSIHSADTPNGKNKAISSIQIAMARLVDEFHDILKLGAMSSEMITSIDHYQDTHSSSITDSPSSYYYEFHEDDFIEGNITSSRVISDLQSIAMTINDAGYLHDCVQVYTSVRSSVIASSFQRLHVQKLSKRDAQTLDWGSLESIIRNWNRSARVLIISIFPNEKRLCEEIFNGVGSSIDDACFTKIVKDPAIQLFDTAEALTSVLPSPDKLFRTLDLYNTLSRLLPSILTLFNSESSEFLTVKAANLLPKMAEAVRGILYAFEKDVLYEQSPVSLVGKIHSLTRYVINHLLVMCDTDYKQTLMVLITSMTPLANKTGVVVELLAEFEQQTPLSLHFIWIIMSLISNLESKTKVLIYEEDTALGHFFFMNNVHYIVQNVVSSPELSDMVGDAYQEKLIGILHQVKADYLSLTLEKILYSLHVKELNGCGICTFRASKVRKRSKSFSLLFEKVQKDFGSFAIWDCELLDDLKKSISEKLIPAYSLFLGHFQKVTGSTKRVKYSATDLETAIVDLGTPKSSSL